jgi:hypothetical protein
MNLKKTEFKRVNLVCLAGIFENDQEQMDVKKILHNLNNY